MGCSISRLDNEEVVMLCKERKRLIKQAMDKRYSLAEAHVCYIHSLRNVGYALSYFAEMKNITMAPKEEEGSRNDNIPSLTLPNHPKALPEGSPPPSPSASSSPSLPSAVSSASNSPSTIRTLDSAQEVSCCSSSPSTCSNSPATAFQSPLYLRSMGNPPLSVEERHPSPETLRMNSFVFPHYAATDFFQHPTPLSDPSATYDSPKISMTRDSTDTPPPPPPPRSFPWDFFNFFPPLEDQFVFHGHPRTSRNLEEDLKLVREEEGIPDLEEDGVVIEEKREVQFEEGTVEPVSSEEDLPLSSCVEESFDSDEASEVEKVPIMEDNNSVEVLNEQKVEVVNAVGKEAVSERKDIAVVDSKRRKNLVHVMKDIEDQFTRAYVSGKTVSKMLEANRVHYHSGFSEIKEHSSKVISAITSHRSMCSPAAFSKYTSFDSFRDIDESDDVSTEDPGMMSGSHASTLERLYAWEKKLYDEVKAGERMRITYEKKCSQLRNQNAKREDPQSVDKARVAIKDLHTRIRIAIQAVDSVSKKIQKVRDDELQPQLLELSHGFLQMWKVMLESHETQSQIIAEAQCLANSAGGTVCSESHRQATLRLETELQKWHSSFARWISAQKAYIQTLNCWLLKCIIQEPERSSKANVLFSPRKFGAPPIFRICKHWLLAYEKLPEAAVINSIRSFAGNMRFLRLQHDEELRQKWKADRLARDFDRRISTLERFESRMMEYQFSSTERDDCSLGNSLIPLSSVDSFRQQVDEEKTKHLKAMEETRHATLSTLHRGLKSIFEALTKFASLSLKSCEELCAYDKFDGSICGNSNLPHLKDR